ncbi:MAG: VCBS repeat-containing protein [Planctomycetes bacterium]|nr:VCBS repeat-containing protein [Planctomycetota bacterium]
MTAGVYKPDRDSDNRDASYEMLNGVVLYGGFVGGEENLEERDPETNETILSADLQDNDAPNAGIVVPTVFDNSFHVLLAENELGERVVRLKRNELTDNGQLSFTDIISLVTNDLTRIVLAGDLNNDGRPDIIAINDGEAAPLSVGLGSSLAVHINNTNLLCPRGSRR